MIGLSGKLYSNSPPKSSIWVMMLLPVSGNWISTNTSKNESGPPLFVTVIGAVLLNCNSTISVSTV